METLVLATIVFLATVACLLIPQKAHAHCDTMDGPAVKDAQLALKSGNINYAFKWILPPFETELMEIFDKARKTRELGSEAQEVADRWFLENFVRIHRAGEGEPYDGLKPSGTVLDPKVVAADEAVDREDLSPMKSLVSAEEYHHLEEKFQRVIALKNYDINDVKAARAYVEAYVTFFKLAEGEEHGHAHEHHQHHAH